jgi:hypothetical protein
MWRAPPPAYGAGGVTVRTNDPLAPLQPSTMMLYVCPAVTEGVIRDWAPHELSLHVSWAPRWRVGGRGA